MSYSTSRGRKSALLVLAVLAWLGGAAGATAQTSQCVASAIAGGTPDALTIPQLPCTPTTSLLILTLSQTNLTNSPTLQALGQGPAKPLVYADGTGVGVGALGAGHTVPVTFNGTSWLILATPVAAGSGITQLTGDGTAGPGSGSQPLALVPSGVAAATYGDSLHVPQCTYDTKGRATLCVNVPITGGFGTVTNALNLTNNALVLGDGGTTGVKTTATGTGIVTALGINIGSAGAPVLFNGAGGTPSSLGLANATGLPLTSGVTSILPGANGGTGVANTGKTLTLGASTSLPAAPGSTQCLHEDNTGAITTTGSDCGAGGGGGAGSGVDGGTGAATVTTSGIMGNTTTVENVGALAGAITRTLPAISGIGASPSPRCFDDAAGNINNTNTLIINPNAADSIINGTAGVGVGPFTKTGGSICFRVAATHNWSIESNNFFTVSGAGGTAITSTASALTVTTTGSMVDGGASTQSLTAGATLANGTRQVKIASGWATGTLTLPAISAVSPDTCIRFNDGGNFIDGTHTLTIKGGVSDGLNGGAANGIMGPFTSAGDFILACVSAVNNWNIGPGSVAASSATSTQIVSGIDVNGLTYGTVAAASKTFWATPSSANLAAAITDETGTGLAVFGTSPNLLGTPTLGANGGTVGAVKIFGNTSGDATITVPAAAGTATRFQLPATNGSNTNVLQTDGSGNTSWVAGGAGGSGAVTKIATVSANNSSNILTIATGLTAEYVQIKCSNLRLTTDADKLWIQVSSGASFKTTTYKWAQYLLSLTSPTFDTHVSTSDLGVAIAINSLATSSGIMPINIEATIGGMTDTSFWKNVDYTATLSAGTDFYRVPGHGAWTGGNGAIDGVRLIAFKSDGTTVDNIISGSCTPYTWAN